MISAQPDPAPPPKAAACAIGGTQVVGYLGEILTLWFPRSVGAVPGNAEERSQAKHNPRKSLTDLDPIETASAKPPRQRIGAESGRSACRPGWTWSETTHIRVGCCL